MYRIYFGFRVTDSWEFAGGRSCQHSARSPPRPAKANPWKTDGRSEAPPVIIRPEGYFAVLYTFLTDCLFSKLYRWECVFYVGKCSGNYNLIRKSPFHLLALHWVRVSLPGACNYACVPIFGVRHRIVINRFSQKLTLLTRTINGTCMCMMYTRVQVIKYRMRPTVARWNLWLFSPVLRLCSLVERISR